MPSEKITAIVKKHKDRVERQKEVIRQFSAIAASFSQSVTALNKVKDIYKAETKNTIL